MRTLEQIHQDMETHLQLFERTLRDDRLVAFVQDFTKSLAKARPLTCQFWLNRYHDDWDDVERLGIELGVIPIPLTQHCWDHLTKQPIQWNQHHGVTEPTRTINVLHRPLG